MKPIFKLSFLLFLVSGLSSAQNPEQFKMEIARFSQMPVPEGEVIVITGSSSVRFWNVVAEDCSNASIVNTGFGGSQMSDLLYYIDDAVLRFDPSKVYIYEGDNDINAGKQPQEVMDDLMAVLEKIYDHNPETKVYLIGAKPSPSRWQFQAQYLALNQRLEAYSESTDGKIGYIDVWNPMLNETGRPKPEIFIMDSLHMNRKGYDIWKEAICPYMD